MKNYKAVLQYEGTKYQGWQKQTSTGNTIQGKLEVLLGKMCGVPIEVHGAGRTDSGVHALGQVIHFRAATDKSPEEIRTYMNDYLPEDIAIITLTEAPERFHSRLHATGKKYQYCVRNSRIPDVFRRRYVYMMPQSIDLERMREAAAYLVGKHDFKAFTSKGKTKKSTIRTITGIDIRRSGEEVQFTYEGDGFLYHMVRILTGTLLEVGRSERKPEDIPKILMSGKREDAGELLPGCGLTLIEVYYQNGGIV